MEKIVGFILFFLWVNIIQLCCEEIGITKTLFANMNLIRIYDRSFYFLLTLVFCHFLGENTFREQKILIIKAFNFRSEKMLWLFWLIIRFCCTYMIHQCHANAFFLSKWFYQRQQISSLCSVSISNPGSR